VPPGVEDLVPRLAGDQPARLPDPKLTEVEGVFHTDRLYSRDYAVGVSSSTITGSGPAS
jgi:hypothetical protein